MIKIRKWYIIVPVVIIIFGMCLIGLYKWHCLKAIEKNKRADKQITMTVNSQSFDLDYQTFRVPYVFTVIVVIVNNKRIYSYDIDSEFKKPKITLVQDDANLKVYEFSSGEAEFIVFNIDNKGFKAFNGDLQSTPISKSEEEAVYPVLKKLFMTKRFECIERYGYFLLCHGDKDVKACLERYKNSGFTDEELNINKDSVYDPRMMRTEAESFLVQYEKQLNSSSK